MKPTVARIVHYQSYGTPKGEYKSRPVAAIITDVRAKGDEPAGATELIEANYQVRLKIFNPDGHFNSPWLDYDKDGAPGTWRWPPRE